MRRRKQTTSIVSSSASDPRTRASAAPVGDDGETNMSCRNQSAEDSVGAKPAPRCAFTLIELLVVVTLIAILAAIGVAFLPAIGDASRQAQAATMLQQWILTAKQKALRDQVPYGVRLLPYIDPNSKLPVG